MVASITDIAYAAGLLDGEGCVTITRHKDNRDGYIRYLPYITITNTNIRMVEWLVPAFGGSYTIARHYGKWNDCYTWYLCTWDSVREFIGSVRPFIQIKCQQIELLIGFLDLGTSVGKKLDQNLIIARTDYYLDMKELNYRGRKEQ